MTAQSQQATYQSIISCFPQMRPEVASTQEEEDIELSEDEKLIINLLKAIKGLTKNKLAKVEKTDEGLFVSVV